MPPEIPVPPVLAAIAEEHERQAQANPIFAAASKNSEDGTIAREAALLPEGE